MSDEHTPTLQNIAADRDCWSAHAGEQYRELAHWLRGIAAECRLPYSQRELLISPGVTMSEPIGSAAEPKTDDR
jgi:hypothetical protein